MRLAYCFAKDYISDFRSNRGAALMQLLSLFAISLVLITSIQVLLSFFYFYGESRTSVYNIPLKSGVSSTELREALAELRAHDEAAFSAQIYAPVTHGKPGPVVGLDQFHNTLYVWNKVDESMLKGDQHVAWLSSSYWEGTQNLSFPYEQIAIDGKPYQVAGVNDVDCRITSSPYMSGAPDVEDMLGIALPIYGEDGLSEPNAFDAEEIIALPYEEDTISQIMGWEFGQAAVFIPLNVFLAEGYPACGITLWYDLPPSTATQLAVESSFSSISVQPIAKLKGISFMNLAGILSAICFAAMIGAMLLLLGGYYTSLLDRRYLMRCKWICGANRCVLATESILHLLISATIGFELALFIAPLLLNITPQDVVWLNLEQKWMLYGGFVAAIGVLSLMPTNRVIGKVLKSEVTCYE